MRKLIILAASLVALAALIATPFANAAVTYDDQSVGSVDKTDVQSLFGWNDPTLQAKAKSGDVKFTSKYTLASSDVWACSDGSTQSRTSTVTQSRSLNVTPLTNPHGKVLGWMLNGIDENKGGTYLGGERTGAPYVGYCPAGGFTGFLPHVFTNTVVPGVYVNGVDLPVTPVVAPVV